jgi:phosphonate transport system permease protein
MKTMAPYTLPSERYRQRATIGSLVALAFAGACTYMGFNPAMIFTEFHYVVDLAVSMTPPDFSLFWMDTSILVAVGETLSMAFLGTLIGGCLALGFALLGTADTMPYRWVRLPVRIVLSTLRVVPTLILVIIFVVTVGLGAFAGMLTLVVSTIGNFGQLFMEVIASTEKSPAEAIYSAGASRVQVVRYAIFPQIFPSLVANFFYAFDVNLRGAIGLGIFGGGGVGFQLFLAMRTLHYRDALALICLTVVLIVLMEKLSDHLRKRLLGAGSLK